MTSKFTYAGKPATEQFQNCYLTTLTDGKVTISDAHIHIGDKVFQAAGSARRMKGDVNDPYVGELLSTYRALSRLLDTMGKEVKRVSGNS